MITSSPSPTLHGSAHSSPSATFASRPHYDGPYRNAAAQSSLSRPFRAAPTSTTSSSAGSSSDGPSPSSRAERDRRAAQAVVHRQMVDAGTQYSQPKPPSSANSSSPSAPESLARVRMAGAQDPVQKSATGSPIAEPSAPHLGPQPTDQPQPQQPIARFSSKRTSPNTPPLNAQGGTFRDQSQEGSGQKRARPENPDVKVLPLHYEDCNVRDLVILISSMLMELIRFNDDIPLKDGHLTRFHSRAPPGISVQDYLQRLATHATLSPPILLSMVYYIDRLCALYPAFTISSLTVHRFLITSATVASKGLSDSFWTNRTYARVGGVSIKELALLELEFLWRVEWRIVPRPEVLVDYYRSLVERSEGYEIEASSDEENEADEGT